MILSATSVSFNYGYDSNISYNGGVVYTLDGLDYTNTGLLASAVDVTLNNEQILVLTQNIKLSESLTNTTLIPKPESYVYSTLIQDYAGRYLYATDPLNTQGSLISLTTVLASATVFNFYFPSTPSTIQIFYTVPYQTTIQNLFLICNNNTISGGQINGVPSTNYTYYYLLSGAAFSLVSTLPVINTQWLVSNGSNSLSFTGISGISSNTLVLPASAIFCATNLNNNNSYGSLQSTGQSDLIKYKNVTNELVIDKTSGNVPFNYLISSAYKNLSANNNIIDANINTLKNYYSPMHGQTAVLSASLRNYTKLYTGLNENNGSSKIYLGYNANTSKLTFTKDKNVYFHYPYGTSVLPLSDTTLVDYGARADVSPFRADKIFKKSATNSTYTSWGTTTNYPQNGVFFCSWLSAANYGDNNILKPVWVDRYYNPAIVNLLGINSNTILSLSSLLVGGINNYPNLIFDVPSTLTFEPGALYYYHRIGEQDNQTIVNSLTGLMYHIENWSANLVNTVNGLTAGSIEGFQSTNSVNDNTIKTSYYNTNGTYGYINSINSDFTYNSGFTMSFYAYQSDWTNIQGDQIVGNYFNGGVGLFNVNKILTPYFTVAARIDSSVGVVSSTLQTYNTDLVLLNTEKFDYTNYVFTPGFGGSSTDWQTLSSAWATPSFVLKTTYDKQQYVIDNYAYNNYLTTLDFSDLITNKVSLSSSIYSSTGTLTGGLIVDAYVIPNSNGNIVTKTHPTNSSVTYRKFNFDGSLLYSYTNTDYNNFTVDLYGNTVWYNTNIPTPLNSATQAPPISGYDMWNGTNATVDNNNNVFSLSGNGIQGTSASSWVIVKNGKPGISVVKPDYINCDQDNNIWITYNNNYVLKIDSNGNVIWSKQINTNNPIITPYSTRVINFIAENTVSGITYYGLIIDGKSQYVYKLDMNGNVVSSLYIPGLIPGGDSTGFDYQRKYIAPYVTTPGIQAKFVVQDSTLPTPIPNYITLTYSTSALEAGWHHFGLTFSQDNVAGLFVDGKLVNEIPVSTNTTLTDQFGNPLINNSGDNIVGLNKPYALYSIYNYKNNPQIAIGTSNFKTGTLNTWIKKPDTYLFNGGIADLRVYDIALKTSDLKALTKNYLINQFTDLDWNVPTGVRGYIEEIERFFLHRLPGSKSQFYNIRIKNSNITDPSVQAIVEENIRAAALNTAPAHTQLRSIIWE